jgi:hypothetical protein
VVHRVDDPVLAYRIVRSVNTDDPVIVDSFRSNYELDARPRGMEVESTLIHLGLSMYLKSGMAIATPNAGHRSRDISPQFTSRPTKASVTRTLPSRDISRSGDGHCNYLHA